MAEPAPGHVLGIVAPYAAQVEARGKVGQNACGRSRDCARRPSPSTPWTDFKAKSGTPCSVSLTRSNDKGEVGFLSESRRIHVAQTRAKMACMLVGDSATLSTDAFLAELFEHAQAHDAYDSAWSWMV